MSRHGRLHHTARWVALLALLMATLAPSLAHAQRHARGETLPWSQLCSATGSKRVVFESPTDDPGSQARTHAFEQCGVCAVQPTGWAPPSPVVTHTLRTDLQDAAPANPALQLHRQLAWLSAQPRAPPQLP